MRAAPWTRFFPLAGEQDGQDDDEQVPGLDDRDSSDDDEDYEPPCQHAIGTDNDLEEDNDCGAPGGQSMPGHEVAEEIQPASDAAHPVPGGAPPEFDWQADPDEPSWDHLDDPTLQEVGI